MPRKCPSGSPVQEKRGLCADHRKLNAQGPTVLGNNSSGVITLVNVSKIYEILVHLHDSKFFTSLDLINGYSHIKLSPEMRHNSTFTTIFDMYKFLKIPFGLAQGPPYFTAVMQKLLGQFNNFCFFQIDDALVLDPRKNSHLEYLKIVF